MLNKSISIFLRATLDLNLRHINLEKKTTHEVHSRKAREKERDLRNLKKAELQLRVADDNVTHVQQILEKVKGQVCRFMKSFTLVYLLIVFFNLEYLRPVYAGKQL